MNKLIKGFFGCIIVSLFITMIFLDINGANAEKIGGKLQNTSEIENEGN